MSVNLSAQQTKLLVAAFQCFDVQPKIDNEKLAKLMGYSSKASANSRWSELKRVFASAAESGEDVAAADAAGEGGKAKATPKNAGKGTKRKADEQADEDEGRRDSASPAPAKKARKPAAKKAKNVKAEEAEDAGEGEDGEEEGAKVKDESKSSDEGASKGGEDET